MLVPSLKTLSTIVIICQTFAIPTTFFRLCHRCHSRKLWWDDFWALIALLSDIVLCAVFFYTRRFKSQTKIPNTLLYTTRWLLLQSYTIALWSARLTVAVTIVRLLPQGSTTRRLAQIAVMAFGAFETAMVLQKILFCGKKSGFLPRCGIPRYTGIIELVFGVVADLWLVSAPAYMLFRMKLQRAHHCLILAIFLCGILTLLASISYSTIVLLNTEGWIGVTAHIEVAVAIIVSNLLVLVTNVYRVFRNVSNNMALRPAAPAHLSSPRAQPAADHPTNLTSTPDGTALTAIGLTQILESDLAYNTPLNSNSAAHGSSGWTDGGLILAQVQT